MTPAPMREDFLDAVHRIDQERLWREIPIGLQALETFATAVAAWLPDP